MIIMHSSHRHRINHCINTLFSLFSAHSQLLQCIKKTSKTKTKTRQVFRVTGWIFFHFKKKKKKKQVRKFQLLELLKPFLPGRYLYFNRMAYHAFTFLFSIYMCLKTILDNRPFMSVL